MIRTHINNKSSNTTNMGYQLQYPLPEIHDESELYPCFNRLSLWSFIFDLLEERRKPCVKWTDRENLEFKVEDTDGLAQEWGRRKGRTTMTWPKFARAMRYYYGKGVLEKVEKKRFTYKFINSPKTRPVFHQRRRTSAYRSTMAASPMSSGSMSPAAPMPPLISSSDLLNVSTQQNNTFDKYKIESIRRELENSLSGDESNESNTLPMYTTPASYTPISQPTENMTWPSFGQQRTAQQQDYYSQYNQQAQHMQQQPMFTQSQLQLPSSYPPCPSYYPSPDQKVPQMYNTNFGEYFNDEDFQASTYQNEVGKFVERSSNPMSDCIYTSLNNNYSNNMAEMPYPQQARY